MTSNVSTPDAGVADNGAANNGAAVVPRETPDAEGKDTGSPPVSRRRRGPRRAVQEPTRLPGEAAHGVVEGWEARVAAPSPARPAGAAASASGAVVSPSGAAAPASAAGRPRGGDPLLPTQPESESDAAWGEASASQDAAARDAWYRAQRPPHWG